MEKEEDEVKQFFGFGSLPSRRALKLKGKVSIFTSRKTETEIKVESEVEPSSLSLKQPKALLSPGADGYASSISTVSGYGYADTTTDEESDSDSDRLGPKDCYFDAELETICNAWSPLMPDYTHIQENMNGARDSMSHIYVEELRRNHRLAKPRNLFLPSFGSSDLDMSSSSKHSTDTDEGINSGANKDDISSVNTSRNVNDKQSPLDLENAATAKSKRKSVVEAIKESIGKAIKNGNTSFVEGPLHPLQTNLSLLTFNRRSGYSNVFSADEYLAYIPIVRLPPLPGSVNPFE